MIRIQPVGLYLKVLPHPEPIKSSIILDEKTQDKLSPFIKGIIIDKGAGNRNQDLSMFKKDAKEPVFYPKVCGIPIEQNGVTYHLVHIDDIEGIYL